MLHTIIMVSHVLIAVGLIVIILLQRGKGAEAGTAFGAGASGTVFGSRGTGSFMTRTTAVLATLFFVTSLTLAFMSSQVAEPTSVIERLAPADGTVPATPDMLGAPSDVNTDLPLLPEPDSGTAADDLPETPPQN